MSRHLYIAGVDRIADLERGSLRIEQALTFQIDTCSFSIKGEQPAEGEEVIVEDDELRRLFAGIIVKVELGRTFPDKSIKVWNVDCDDYTALLDRRLVVEAYENMSASDIFLDIVAKYCPGFTTNGVRSGAPVVESTGAEFEYKRPSECFRWLCDYVGWHWQPDYYKDLHFFSAEELASPAPMVLRPGGQFRFGKHTIDTQGLRNRVYVRGGTMLSDPQVVRWKADGVARIWALPWPPHEVSLTVGEVPMTVGVENLHDEADFDYMMSFSEKYIRCSSNTSTPAEGTTMSLTARQDIPVITMVEDYASQAAISKVQGGDGIYEHVISDDSLTSIAAAEAAGMADLREHANPRVKGSFETEYTKPPELTPTALSYTESGEDFEEGELDGVVAGEDGLEIAIGVEEYLESGTRISPPIDVGKVSKVVGSSINWEATTINMGKALEFNGINDNVNIGLHDIGLAYTFECWLTPKAYDDGIIISNGLGTDRNRFFIRVRTDGYLQYYTNDELSTFSILSETKVELNKPSHIAVIRSGNVGSIIINGEENGSGEVAPGAHDGGRAWYIGARRDFSYPHAGVIDDIRIWAVARTEQQIRDNMYKELIGNEPGLIGYWKLNEGEGITAYDSAGNNDGIISGATWVNGLTTSLTIETALSTDNGQTWGEWQEATNGGNIPGIMAGMDLAGCRLKTRATLETTDTGITPVLNSLTISLTGEKLEPRIWQPGQIVEINLPDRGIQGEYLIQRVVLTPVTPKHWAFRVEYGGRLFGIADFLQALVSAQQKKRIIEPTRNVQKYIYGEDTLELSDELITTPRTLPFVCGDPDAVCGLVVVSSG